MKFFEGAQHLHHSMISTRSSLLRSSNATFIVSVRNLSMIPSLILTVHIYGWRTAAALLSDLLLREESLSLPPNMAMLIKS
jgi:hypothetical protein